jgi:hypothetical protein
MLKRPITYEDFDGEKVTEDFYFNISKSELVELEAERKGGFSAWIQEIIKIEDTNTLMQQFKRMILLAYGEKSADGKYFIKNDELRARFASSAAYDALFWEIFTDEGKMAEFVTAIVPKDQAEKLSEDIAKNQAAVAVAPSPPTPPAIPQT